MKLGRRTKTKPQNPEFTYQLSCNMEDRGELDLMIKQLRKYRGSYFVQENEGTFTLFVP